MPDSKDPTDTAPETEKSPDNGRRSFLTGGLVGAAAGMVSAAFVGALRGRAQRGGGSGPAVHTGRNVEWRMASSFPASLDTLYGTGEVLVERVAAMTGGRFRIRLYQAGELVPPLQVFDAVEKGAAEAGQTASYYYTGKHPALAFDTCVPFGFTMRQQDAWQHEAGGLELIRGIYKNFGLLTFPGGNTGTQMGGWFRKRIDSADDLRGLRIRIPGLGGQVLDRLGASVQVLGGGETYTALERGALDAAEWVGPYDDLRLGLGDVAKLYYYPGWWEPGPSMNFLVNQRAFDALPSEYQAIFAAATKEASTAMTQRYDTRNPGALATIRGKGVEVIPFPDDVLTACRAASEQLLADSAARDTDYRRVLENWRSFRGASDAWMGTSELRYAREVWG